MELKMPSHLEVGYQELGVGFFQIQSIQNLQKNTYAYKGKLIRFISETEKAQKNIPVKVYSKTKIDANYTYYIKGTLSRKCERFYSFKPLKGSPWEKGSFKISLIHLRFQLKEKLKRSLSKKIHNSYAKHLFISLASGDVESRFLRYAFSRIGLSHILAISGFHFALIIGFFAYLRFFFSQKVLNWILLILANCYLLFLGISPSILRAWVLVELYLISRLIERPTSSLNLLGIALLINLLIQPMDIFHLGFQFSYLSYLGIILFFQPIDRSFSRIIKNRKMQELTFLSKIAYPILLFFRKSFSLNIAVHLVITPVLLFHFYKCPLYTLFYNLFIPSLIGVLMYLLLIGFILQLTFLFKIIEMGSIFLLKTIIYPPTICEFFLRWKNMPYWIVIFYLIILLMFNMTKKKTDFN